MGILRNVIGGLFGLMILVFLGGFILPSTVHIERDIVINAPPADIFPLISDLTEWPSWSPWAKMDPNMTMTVDGSGIGQTLHWQSEDPMVGKGTQQMTDLETPDRVNTHLNFGEKGIADAAFKLTPQDNGTLVTWSLATDMRAGVPILKQPFSTYFRFVMDNAVGQDYEAGLANLKTLVE